jgi:pre-mRNA-splicing factor CWC22
MDQRLSYLIENFFTAMAKAKGIEKMGYPAIPEGLDLVEPETQITHDVSLQEPAPAQPELDVFKFDPEFEKHEADYKVTYALESRVWCRTTTCFIGIQLPPQSQ